MRKIHGYNISLWALMFHMKTQAKYVIESDKDVGEQSFIHPLAIEIDIVLGKVLRNEVLLSYELTIDERIAIANYIKTDVDPVVKTRKIRPAILLLSTVIELYQSEFAPAYEVLGEGVVKDFAFDFSNRLSNNEKTKDIYYESCVIVKSIATPYTYSYAEKKTIDRYKKEFTDVLEKAYGDSEAHGWKHIDSVMYKAFYLKNKYNIEVSIDELVSAVLFHDIFNSIDRDNHHTLASEWVDASIHPMLNKSKDSRKRIAMAIKEHRASYNEEYYSPLSELLATADREKPILKDILFRMYKHIEDTTPNVSHKEKINMMKKHLREKYSRTGYIQYTNMYILEHKNDLAIMLDQIDSILANKLVIKVSNLFNKLTIDIKRK